MLTAGSLWNPSQAGSDCDLQRPTGSCYFRLCKLTVRSSYCSFSYICLALKFSVPLSRPRRCRLVAKGEGEDWDLQAEEQDIL